MQLRLRTKLTLVMTGLVFLVVVVLSAVFMARLTSQVIHETNTRANELSQQIFEQAKHALEDAKQAGMREKMEQVARKLEGKGVSTTRLREVPHHSVLDSHRSSEEILSLNREWGVPKLRAEPAADLIGEQYYLIGPAFLAGLFAT